MRSKSERRLLGQGLWSNLFYYLHINYAIAVLSSHSAWLIVFVFQKVGWNVRGVKCPWGEMSEGWNVFGVKCLWGEMYRGEMSWGEMSSGWNVLTPNGILGGIFWSSNRKSILQDVYLCLMLIILIMLMFNFIDVFFNIWRPNRSRLLLYVILKVLYDIIFKFSWRVLIFFSKNLLVKFCLAKHSRKQTQMQSVVHIILLKIQLSTTNDRVRKEIRVESNSWETFSFYPTHCQILIPEVF